MVEMIRRVQAAIRDKEGQAYYYGVIPRRKVVPPGISISADIRYQPLLNVAPDEVPWWR